MPPCIVARNTLEHLAERTPLADALLDPLRRPRLRVVLFQFLIPIRGWHDTFGRGVKQPTDSLSV